MGLMVHVVLLNKKDFVSRFLNLFYIKSPSLRGREVTYFITLLSDTEEHRYRGIWQPVKSRPTSEVGIKTIQILL